VRVRRFAVGAALAVAALAAHSGAQAGGMNYCDRHAELSATQQDKLLRFAALIKGEMEASGSAVALVSRSGLDLSRFGQRYSHAGLALQDNPNAPWSVRQLYYACDERAPRLFDQGMAGFLMGTDNPAVGYVSLLFVPGAAGAELARSALDKPRALQLLSPHYSANAYPFDLRYQNCNQWVAELLAAAWGAPGAAPEATTRAGSQAWLKAQGYVPSLIDVGNPALMLVGNFIPFVHHDDHPQEDVARWRYRVSMPASVEAFVRAQVPQATRVEFCHNDRQMVVRRGGPPMAEGCQAEAGDTVLALD
jgi:hypothetical protein